MKNTKSEVVDYDSNNYRSNKLRENNSLNVRDDNRLSTEKEFKKSNTV